MTKVLAAVISILISSAVLGADMTVIGRFTADGGRDLGLITKYGEIWTLGIEQPHPTIEIGKVVLYGNAYVGGYVSYWGSSRKMFLEPFAVYAKEFGEVRLRAKAYAYLPINGGKVSIGSDEISLTYKISNNTRIGPLVNFWKQDGEDTLTSAGFQIECQLDRSTSFILRKTEGDLAQIRLAVCHTF